jgi:hypothetical protein
MEKVEDMNRKYVLTADNVQDKTWYTCVSVCIERKRERETERLVLSIVSGIHWGSWNVFPT